MSNWLDHSSIVGKLGGQVDKYLNPVSWITGGKSTTLTSQVLPDKVNAGLSKVMQPFDYIDQKVNPVRKIPIVNRAANIIKAKPGDAGALAVGAAFGGEAALGGGAAGGSGAGYAGEVGLTGSDVGTGAAAGDGLGGALGSSYGGEVGLTSADVGAGGGSADGGSFVLNNAQDSQLANQQLGLQPVTSDDTVPANSSSSYQQQGSQQKKRQPQPTAVGLIVAPSEDQYASIVQNSDAAIAQSSKGVKTRGATQAAMARGLQGLHPVDTNGVHVAAIQELKKQIDSVGARIAALKSKRASKGA